jgi:hypothetical protein
MNKKLQITKLMGTFILMFGIFFLLLSLTHVFNDQAFVNEYNSCIEVSSYDPTILTACKANVSNGLNIVIRYNQIKLSSAQFIKIYLKELIEVLFSILLIILGDYIYNEKEEKKIKTKTKIIKKRRKK